MPSCPRKLLGEPASAIAVVFASGALLIGWAVYESYYGRHAAVRPVPTGQGMFPEPDGINAYLLQQQGGIHDVRGQGLAHRFTLLVIAASLGLLAARGSPLPERLPEAVWIACRGIAIIGIGVFLIWAVKCQDFPLRYYAVGGVAVFLGWWLGRRLRTSRLNRCCGILSLALLAALCGPTVLMRLDHSHRSWTDLEVMQAHYTLLLSQGDRLAAGFRPGDEVLSSYGAILPFCTAVYQRFVGGISLKGYILLINLLQTLYLAVATYGYYVYGRRKWFLALVGLLFVGVHYHFYNQFQLSAAPNHTAWRAIGLPMTCGLLLLLRKAPFRRTALLLGMAGGAALLQNPESGMACLAGMVTFLLFRHVPAGAPRPLARLLAMAGCFAVGMAASLLVFAAASRGLLGPLPSLGALADYVRTMKTVARSGYAGGTGPLDPMAILILGHASANLIHASMKRRIVSDFHGCLRAAVSTMILVWFAYYANRPHPAYLISFHVLYGFLLVDAVRLLLAMRRLAVVRWPAMASAGILAVMIVPYLETAVKDEWANYRRGIGVITHGVDADKAILLSGVYFPRDARARAIEEKAAFLRQVGQDAPVVYFTADSYLVPKLSGVWPRIPMAEVFWESVTRRQYEKLVQGVVESRADAIYFDSKEPIAFQSTPSTEFYQQLRRDLSGRFQRDSSIHGWERWRRR